MRFFLLDRVTQMVPGEVIHGIKCWSLSDDVFDEHFPGMPIVPGVFVIESMAQLLGMLIEHSYASAFPDDAEGVYAILSIVHKAKFKKFTIPGDRMTLCGNIGTLDRCLANGRVVATVEGETRAEAHLSFVLIPKAQFTHSALQRQRDDYYRFLCHGLDKIRSRYP